MSMPIYEIQFDKDANPVQPSQEQAVIAALTASSGAPTDVIVLSHGWNNDMDEARTLYRDFLNFLDPLVPAGSGKNLAAIGVLWPSKKFADSDLIPGGAASINTDIDPAGQRALLDRLQEMKNLFADDNADRKLDQMKTLVTGLANDTAKQNDFVRLLAEAAAPHLDNSQSGDGDGSAKLAGPLDGSGLLNRLAKPVGPRVNTSAGGAAGGGSLGGNPAMAGGAAAVTSAAGISDVFNGIKAGAMRLLNLTTYYVMKDRAGKIGSTALNPMLSRIQAKVPGATKFHFAGHSFGGRLVTATVDGPQTLRVQTLLLLQAAYSHNGLALKFDTSGKNGFFHNVLDKKKVVNPILITHTNKDKAVGLAYPLASRLNGDDAAAIGDKNDIFGGMGANGAQHADASDSMLLNAGGVYNFPALGKQVINLNGDNIIMSHGDVARPETALVLAAAIKLP